MSLPDLKQPFVIGSMNMPVGEVPRVSSSLTRADHWGTFKARWSVGRMDYTVEPGLYALNRPTDQSPVLVTANYKMSFDSLRQALWDFDAWILVLDTDGINVWCAAGKGTFGTDELVARIKSNGLEQIVAHRRLILPQLSGPGIAAFKVKKLSGFKAVYGPIRAMDLKAFFENGLKATPAMRKKSFPLWERIVLIPVELVAALKPALFVLAFFFVLGGFGGPGDFWTNSLNYDLFAVIALTTAILSGAILTPILLPYLPGRAFALKGFILGLLTAIILALFRNVDFASWPGRLVIMAWFFLVPAVSAFVAMNFTGASTYT
ncbi:MAG: acetyl-CoA synthase subunit gamma, partial [Desulfobacteraceae bacterium]|nr:acetyl-CoA synthase subunit gamma [Desulfobacteraceae bacterium]